MLAPSGAVAETGSTSSQSPNSRMKTIAVTNSGIAVNDTPVTVITRSVRLLRRRPAIAPPMMLRGTRITNATAASLSEFVKDGPRRLETETWYCNDVPRSPWTKWVTQSQYCVTRGRSVPAAWLKRSTSCWLAKLPRTFRPTSPGKSEDAANTSTLRMNSVISA